MRGGRRAASTARAAGVVARAAGCQGAVFRLLGAGAESRERMLLGRGARACLAQRRLCLAGAGCAGRQGGALAPLLVGTGGARHPPGHVKACASSSRARRGPRLRHRWRAPPPLPPLSTPPRPSPRAGPRNHPHYNMVAVRACSVVRGCLLGATPDSARTARDHRRDSGHQALYMLHLHTLNRASTTSFVPERAREDVTCSSFTPNGDPKAASGRPQHAGNLCQASTALCALVERSFATKRGPLQRSPRPGTSTAPSTAANTIGATIKQPW